MTISLDTEIVSTRFDPSTRTCAYVVQKDGKQWTVELPLSSLDSHGTAPGHLLKRRAMLIEALGNVMRGPHDGERGIPTIGAVDHDKAREITAIVTGNGLVSKEAARYREGADGATCAGCAYFGETFSCAKVEGDILPNAMCDHYEAAK